MEYKFIPDDELLKFATEFSNNYKLFTCGTYCSDDKKYTISYLESSDKFKGARVSHLTGKIEMNKESLLYDKITSDYVFYLIIWAVVMFDVISKNENESNKLVESDIVAISYYLSTGRSKKNLLFGFLSIADKSSTFSVERYKKIQDYVDNHKVT